MLLDPPELTRQVAAAVRQFDKVKTTILCEQLITHVRSTDEIYPEREARRVLQHLRNNRYFDLMQKVADVLIQSGQAAPQIRRQYAQSLLDQNNLTAAMCILQTLIADTAADPKENAEAKGLVGRAYKQFYVDAQGSLTERSQKDLKLAAITYHEVYTTNPEQHLWHGINAVALLCRATHDRVPVATLPSAQLLAKAILREIEMKAESDHWDFGTATEACVALNDAKQALDWLRQYVSDPNTNTFELASTHRQLTEVWQLTPQTELGSVLLPVLQAALLRGEGGHLAIQPQDLQRGLLDRLDQEGQLEKVLGRDSFVNFKWYSTGLARCQAVACIEQEGGQGQGIGTGFLLKGSNIYGPLGEELFLLTNAHVLSNDPQIKGSLCPDEALISFQANPLANGTTPTYRVKKILWSSPPDQLDTTLVQLDTPVTGIEPYPIAPALPIIADDDHQRAYIIGHPSGGTLSFSIHDNLLLDHEVPLLHYRTPTEGGSSGSPVFNQQWKLIGIHHASNENMRKLNGKAGTYQANEGISIKSIIDAIAKDLSERSR